MKYARRTDANHAEIRDGLRQAGYPVLDLSACGDGVLDLCVLVSLDPPRSLFLEVKDGRKPPSARKLTEKEQEWMKFNGQISRVVCSLDEALETVRSV
jgi:hypothetical protein